MKRTASIRNQVIARDQVCQRCNVDHDLQHHHVIPLCEGGADTSDNCIALCSYCHRELHLLGIPRHLLGRWLVTPRASVVMAALIDQEKLGDISMETFVRACESTEEVFVRLWNMEAKDAP